MNDALNFLEQLRQVIADWITPFLMWIHGRIDLVTVVCAVAAAGGTLITLIGIFSVRRASLSGEMARLEGVHEMGPIERLQTRLYQSGLRVRVHELLGLGILLGGLLSAPFFVLQFTSIGLMFLIAGPFIYYQYLMNRRAGELRTFREELPIAILDTRDHLTAKANNLKASVLEMAECGPKSLRPEFERAYRMMDLADNEPMALRTVGNSRPEPFFRQFLDCLANHHKGGDTCAILTRIAQGQRSHNRLQSRARSRQAGARIVGLVYMLGPAAMALFMGLVGGLNSREFYQTPIGQLVQILAVLSGLASYWASSRIARRGLYMDEVAGARMPTGDVPALVAADEFGGTATQEDDSEGETSLWGYDPSNAAFANHTQTTNSPLRQNNIPEVDANTDVEAGDPNDWGYDVATSDSSPASDFLPDEDDAGLSGFGYHYADINPETVGSVDLDHLLSDESEETRRQDPALTSKVVAASDAEAPAINRDIESSETKTPDASSDNDIVPPVYGRKPRSNGGQS